jgi:hypothetical protein
MLGSFTEKKDSLREFYQRFKFQKIKGVKIRDITDLKIYYGFILTKKKK